MLGFTGRLRHVIFVLFLMFVCSGVYAQSPGPECIQNGGSLACVPITGTSELQYYGESFDNLASALLHDIDTNALLFFKSAGDLKNKVDAGYNKSFGACRTWSEIQSWTSIDKLFPCDNGSNFGWCIADGNSFAYRFDMQRLGLSYASSCPVIPTKIEVTVYAMQKGFCPDGFVPNAGDKLSATYCVSTSSAPTFWMPKNNGCSRNLVFNPCNVATGNKFESAVDYVAPNVGGLEFVRYYNSSTGVWTHSYQNYIVYQAFNPSSFGGVATLQRADGVRMRFYKGANNKYIGDSDVSDQLSPIYVNGSFNGWTFTTADGKTESYDVNGRLTKIQPRSGPAQTITYSGTNIVVQDAFGRALKINKAVTGQLIQVIDPANGAFSYSYDSAGNLTSVKDPEDKTRIYHYNEAAYTQGANLTHALTGITDENSVRFSIYKYDTKQRVIFSEHAGGADRVQIRYIGDINVDKLVSSEVTDPLGTVHTRDYAIVEGAALDAGGDKPCYFCADDSKSKSYDARGNMLARMDHNGIYTNFEYNDRNLETLRVIAARTQEERSVATTWHPVFRKPVQIIDGTSSTKFDYDATTGNLLKISRSDTQTGTVRAWAYKYNGNGQITEVDGPRTDVADITTLTYDLKGNLTSVKNALGHLTQYTNYDPEGRPTSVTDPNGLVTKFTYDKRGRVLETNRGLETEKFAYDGVGNLRQATMASGEIITYVYDKAHRLTEIVNLAGERIRYTLDPAGNSLKDEVLNAAGLVSKTRSAEFNEYGRLRKVIQSGGRETVFETDANGNVQSVTDPMIRQTGYRWDALNRLRETSIPGGATSIKQEFDLNSRLKTVTNAKDATVEYTSDAFGAIQSTASPDLDGYAVSNQFDGAGNTKTKTDFRGVTRTFTYDALNRITSSSGPGAATVTYGYDAGTYGKGRLTTITDESGTTTRTYDIQGRVTAVSRAFNGLTMVLKYGYDANGRMTSIVYPSGRTVTYRYDRERVVGIDIGDSHLLSEVKYFPFGDVRAWQWGNGSAYSRTTDLDGEIASFTLGKVTATLHRDDAGNILSISAGGNLFPEQRFQYDEQNRLTDYSVSADAGATEHYDYDDAGNRTSATIGGKLYSYEYEEGSDFLLSVSGPVSKAVQEDNLLLSDSAHVLKLDGLRRISSATAGALRTDYLRNGMQQRVTKRATNGATTHFVFDESGNLLAELDASGKTVLEHIWLGSQPVAVLRGGIVNYVFADHLGTPRLITDTAGIERWSWRSNPFGSVSPNENPAGVGKFEYNLRFPGQYFDSESGLHYNYRRDYDPQTGRYLQSDPIGLQGGINTYAYADGNPLSHFDFYGLSVLIDPRLQANVNAVTRGSAEARTIIEAMSNDQNVSYYIVRGAGTERTETRIQQATPGLFDSLLGKPLPRASVIMTINPDEGLSFINEFGKPFDPSIERLIAHEIGHGYSYYRGGFERYTQQYHEAIDTENLICRQRDPKSPLRPKSDHGGIRDNLRNMGR